MERLFPSPTLMLSDPRGVPCDRRLVLRDPADPRRPEPGPHHRGPRPADLPDDVLRLPRHRARGEPVRAQGVRQHLHPDHEPDPGRRRAADRQPRGRRRRACSWPAARPPRRSRSSTSPRPATTSSSSPSLYGGTYNLFHYTLPKLGIEVSFVEDPDDLDSWRAAVRPNTKAFFGETISNPKQDVLDIEGVAGVAHEVGVPLIVDNTVATPYLMRPFEWGADIVVHSATKYLGGHGTSIGGVIVDVGRLRLRAPTRERFPGFNEPDPSYHGLVYARDLGVGGAFGANLSFILKARVQLLRDLGPAISPFNAFLLAQGLETLSLRIERHVANAQAVAEWLEGRDEVEQRRVRGPAVAAPGTRRRRSTRPQGAGARARVRDQGRRRGGQAVRRGARAAQPRRQHRRRPQPGDPPGLDDAQPAVRRGAARDRRHARPGPPRRRASSTSTTSSPTSRPGSAPRRPTECPGRGGRSSRDAAGDGPTGRAVPRHAPGHGGVAGGRPAGPAALRRRRRRAPRGRRRAARRARRLRDVGNAVAGSATTPSSSCTHSPATVTSSARPGPATPRRAGGTG